MEIYQHRHHHHHNSFIHHLKKLTWPKWIVIGAALAISIFILVNSCLPGAESSSISEPVVQAAATVVNTIKPGTVSTEPIPSDFSNFIRKFIGHFSLFGACGLLSTLSVYFVIQTYSSVNLAFSFLYSAIYGFFLSVLTEVIQTFVSGRSGLFTDAMIDFGGYAAGVLIIFIITLIIYLKRHKRVYA